MPCCQNSAYIEETTSVDPLEFLARAVMMVTINGLNQSKPENKSNLQLFEVELIQALALSRKHTLSDPGTDYPAVTERVTGLIRQNAQAYQDQAKSKASPDPVENSKQEMLHLIQRWTLAVRGVRQDYQTRHYAKELATSVNQSFRHYYGCEATEVVAALLAIIDLCHSHIKAHMEDMRADSELKPASIPINIRPPFRFEAGHDSNQLPAGFRL